MISYFPFLLAGCLIAAEASKGMHINMADKPVFQAAPSWFANPAPGFTGPVFSPGQRYDRPVFQAAPASVVFPAAGDGSAEPAEASAATGGAVDPNPEGSDTNNTAAVEVEAEVKPAGEVDSVESGESEDKEDVNVAEAAAEPLFESEEVVNAEKPVFQAAPSWFPHPAPGFMGPVFTPGQHYGRAVFQAATAEDPIFQAGPDGAQHVFQAAPADERSVFQAAPSWFPHPAPGFMGPVFTPGQHYNRPVFQAASAGEQPVFQAAPSWFPHPAPGFMGPVFTPGQLYNRPVFQAASAGGQPVFQAAPTAEQPVFQAAPSWFPHPAPGFMGPVFTPGQHYNRPVFEAAPAAAQRVAATAAVAAESRNLKEDDSDALKFLGRRSFPASDIDGSIEQKDGKLEKRWKLPNWVPRPSNRDQAVFQAAPASAAFQTASGSEQPMLEAAIAGEKPVFEAAPAGEKPGFEAGNPVFEGAPVFEAAPTSEQAVFQAAPSWFPHPSPGFMGPVFSPGQHYNRPVFQAASAGEQPDNGGTATGEQPVFQAAPSWFPHPSPGFMGPVFTPGQNYNRPVFQAAPAVVPAAFHTAHAVEQSPGKGSVEEAAIDNTGSLPAQHSSRDATEETELISTVSSESHGFLPGAVEQRSATPDFSGTLGGSAAIYPYGAMLLVETDEGTHLLAPAKSLSQVDSGAAVEEESPASSGIDSDGSATGREIPESRWMGAFEWIGTWFK